MGVYKIPRIIHIIWAGGNYTLPVSSVRNIILWVSNNQNFKIILWVDEKTSGSSFSELEETYKNLFQSCLKISSESKKDEIGYHQIVDLEVKDIRSDPQVCLKKDPLIDYEIERIDPNYGASSDILRYRILYKYGGVYFDHDIVPNINSLEEVVEEFKDNDRHVIYIDHLSQLDDEKLNEEELLKFPDNWTRVGNDMFICTPENPLMGVFIETVEHKNYHLRQYGRKEEAARLAYSNYDIKLNTIERTGPEVIRRVIQDDSLGLLKKNQDFAQYCIKSIKQEDKSIDVEIKPIKSNAYRLAKPYIVIKPLTNFRATNAGSWLNVSFDFFSYDNPDKIINSLITTIQFEQEYFGILRLEDHLETIKASVKILSDFDELTITANFIEKIANILEPDSLFIVQYFGLNDKVFSFYEKYNLVKKIPFMQRNEVGLETNFVLDLALSKEFFLGARAFLYRDEFMYKFKEKWIDILLESYSQEEIKRIFYRIETGTAITQLILTLEQDIDFESQTLILKKYQEVIEKTMPIFSDQGFSIERIKNLLTKIKSLSDLIDQKASERFLKSFLSGYDKSETFPVEERNVPSKRKAEEEDKNESAGKRMRK